MAETLWKTVLQCFIKYANIRPSNCFLGHLSQRSENLCPHRNLHMSVIAVLFEIAKKREQPGVFQ